MADEKMIRLSQAAREFNVGISTITDILVSKGFEVENKANAKIPFSQLQMLAKEFGISIDDTKFGKSLNMQKNKKKEATNIVEKTARKDKKEQNTENTSSDVQEDDKISHQLRGLKVVDKIDLKALNKSSQEKPINDSPTNEIKTESKENDKDSKSITHNKNFKQEEKIETPKKEEAQKQEEKVVETTPVEEKIETPKKEEVQKQEEKVVKTTPVEEKIETPKKEEVQKQEEKVVETTPVEEKIETPKKEEVQKQEEKVVETTPVEEKIETPKKEEVQKQEKKVVKKELKLKNKKTTTPEQTQGVKIPKATIQTEEKTSDTHKKNIPHQERKDTSKSTQAKTLENREKNSPKPHTFKDKNSSSNNTVVKEKEKKANTIENKEDVVQPTNQSKEEQEVIKAKAKTLKGLTVIDKIELPSERKKKKPIASSDDRDKKRRKRKKKRIKTTTGTNTEGTSQNKTYQKTGGGKSNFSQNKTQGDKKTANTNTSSHNKRHDGNKTGQGGNSSFRHNNNRNNQRGGFNRRGNSNNRNRPKINTEVSDAEIQNQIKATLAQLSGKGTRNTKKGRKYKNKQKENKSEETSKETNKLKVTEFISANDLANLMDVSVTKVISTCMSLGMFVSINQRLDADVITVIADEFGYEAEFISATEDDKIFEVEEKDSEDTLEPRAPIVTIMGHVDHGKTSLLDYVRSSNVTASESGGITQHIGAYDVTTKDGKRIAFLDTPGHEAFTAMRARGAKVTDIVILVVAADDNVMPQTKEAINHAQVANVPIVIAINKVDKPAANPDKIREELAKENVLVESWQGKYQDQEISAKTGQGIDDLLEKVLLEAELLELKANPNKKAVGTIIEASLDKGKGYVSNILVQAGTLKIGDIILAGSHYGRVKAMNDHRGKKLKEAGPATPIQVLGLNGAPQAGDLLKSLDSEREAREIANKREQILREQNIRATKGLTLEEISRRRALGDFKELKIIVKGDVDGSVEALSDSLLKLSTEEIEVKIIHKGVGQISEADIMLASTAEAIIVGFQVRPSNNAKKAAEQEKVQIKLYSVIYNAIEEIKDAMEGMLAPTVEEAIVGNVEVRQVFKISKIGTVAGCYVLDGNIKRANKIRIIRDGIVIYEGEIGALKRFKEDVNEVKSGYECGLSIKSFNDIKEGDVIESFEMRETKRTL